MTSTAADLRSRFLSYFVANGHEQVPSAPLVPSNDPTLLFTNAGMVPFKNLFMGKETRSYTRATTSQKCIRISGKHNDLENVGVTARHHTFFEMLGNFSFGDYFKEQAITLAWEFLTKEVGLDPNRMVVTVFGGEEGVPADEPAEELWRKISGLPDSRILRCGAEDNFWQAGDTGPCGPCSEIHYWVGEGQGDPSRFHTEPAPDGTGWTEIWNLVFMQFDRDESGKLTPLPAPSIDTGMGLERLAVVAQGAKSNYDTDLLRPIVDHVSTLTATPYNGSMEANDVSKRVIADHARTAAFLIAEGIFPDRDGRAYVLRRVMRRAIRHGHRLGLKDLFLHECALEVVNHMAGAYPELQERRALIEDVCRQEEQRFRRTLDRGLTLLTENKQWLEKNGARVLPGKVAFQLMDTYGFPLDLQQVIGTEQGFQVDELGFTKSLEQARKRSGKFKNAQDVVSTAYLNILEQHGPTEFSGYDLHTDQGIITALVYGGEIRPSLETGDEAELVTNRTPFYGESGGQVGDHGVISTAEGTFQVLDTQVPVQGLFVHRGKVTDGTITQGHTARLDVDQGRRSSVRRNHSATHLLHFALRTTLGPTAMQKGSLVGPDRLRFDYSGSSPLTPEQLRTIEDRVNERILKNVAVQTDVLPMDQARSRGAIGIFEEKYGEVVRMLTITEDSVELCGGTHVSRTGDIGMFRILSEQGLAAGVRRIEAATGTATLEHARHAENQLEALAATLKCPVDQLAPKASRLLEKQRELERELEALQKKLGAGSRQDWNDLAQQREDGRFLSSIVELKDPKALREMADSLRDKLAPAVVLLGADTGKGKAILACTVSKQLTPKYRAGDIIKAAAEILGGKGGGRPDFAQAGGPDVEKLEQAVAVLHTL